MVFLAVVDTITIATIWLDKMFPSVFAQERDPIESNRCIDSLLYFLLLASTKPSMEAHNQAMHTAQPKMPA